METKKLNRKCTHCKEIKTVGEGISWQSDPYASDVHWDDTKMWLCDDCAWESAQDI